MTGVNTTTRAARTSIPGTLARAAVATLRWHREVSP
jgi:hypothetical protein